MKKLSLFDLFVAPVKFLQRNGPSPRRVTGRTMRTEQFPEGTIHYSSYRAAYLEKRSTRFRTRVVMGLDGLPLIDSLNGKPMTTRVPIREPWVRVTPKPVRPGAARRAALREARA